MLLLLLLNPCSHISFLPFNFTRWQIYRRGESIKYSTSCFAFQERCYKLGGKSRKSGTKRTYTNLQGHYCPTTRKNLELACYTTCSCLHKTPLLHSGNNLKVAFVKLFAHLSNFRSFLKDILVFNTSTQIECKSRATLESQSVIVRLNLQRFT